MPPRSAILILLFLFAAPALALLRPTAEVPLTNPTFDRATAFPRIASNGNGYLTAWSGGHSIFVVPLSSSGEALRETAIPIAVPQITKTTFAALLDLATDGSNYLIVENTNSTLRTISVDASGNVLAVNDVASLVPDVVATAAVAWNGEKYLLVYSSGYKSATIALFLDRGGKAIGEPFTLLATARGPEPAVASNGHDFLVATSLADACGFNGCASRIYTMTVNDDASPVATNIVLGTTDTFFAHVAWAGSRYVLVWSDALHGVVGANEVPLDSTGKPTRGATVMAVGAFTRTVVATATGPVALLSNAQNTLAMRFDGNGDPVDAQPVPVFDSTGFLSAASSGTELFAVWAREEQAPGISPHSFAYGARIDFTKVQSGSPLAKGAVNETLLAIGTTGRLQLVLYLVRPPLEFPTLYARRLVDGVPLEPPQPIVQAKWADPAVAAAEHDGDFLIVTSESTGRISARLLRSGSPATADIELGKGASDPFAIWTGADFLVIWTELNEHPAEGNPYLRLLARRIGASGELLDAQPRPVSTGTMTNAAYARVVSTPRGPVAIFAHAMPTVPCFGTRIAFRYDLYAVSIDAEGDFAGDPIPIANSLYGTDTDAAADPAGDIFVTWTQPRTICGTPASAHAAVVRSDLSVVRQIDFPTPEPRRVAWSGSAFLVSSGSSLQRYSSQGDALDEIAISASLLAPVPGGVFAASTRTLPEESGSDAQRLVGRFVFDEERRRAVTPH